MQQEIREELFSKSKNTTIIARRHDDVPGTASRIYIALHVDSGVDVQWVQEWTCSGFRSGRAVGSGHMLDTGVKRLGHLDIS